MQGFPRTFLSGGFPEVRPEGFPPCDFSSPKETFRPIERSGVILDWLVQVMTAFSTSVFLAEQWSKGVTADCSLMYNISNMP